MNTNWIDKLIIGKSEKAELYVVISAQEVIERLCTWGNKTGAVTDVCDIDLKNGQEVLTAVIAKANMTLLVVTKQEGDGAKVYLSANGKKGVPILHSIFKIQEIKLYLNNAIDVLLSVTEKFV